MSETVINGGLVLRWLRTEDAEPDLLIGCEIDDGDSEDLYAIVAVDLARQTVGCEGGRRMAFARLGRSQLVAPADHPILAAVEACVSPGERRDAVLKAELGPEYRGAFANSDDLEAVHAAEMSHRARTLPDAAARYRQFHALKRNAFYRQGARVADTWRSLARASGAPWADIALNLAKLLRQAEAPAKAVEVAREALESKDLGGSPRDRAKLATVAAASLIDKYERKGGEKADLIAAWNAAGYAWRYEAERTHEELRNVYRRLEAIGPDPR